MENVAATYFNQSGEYVGPYKGGRVAIPCSFCDSTEGMYMDGSNGHNGPFACANHTSKLSEPRNVDPISPAMARNLKGLLMDPDEATEVDEEGE